MPRFVGTSRLAAPVTYSPPGSMHDQQVEYACLPRHSYADIYC